MRKEKTKFTTELLFFNSSKLKGFSKAIFKDCKSTLSRKISWKRPRGVRHLSSPTVFELFLDWPRAGYVPNPSNGASNTIRV
jgi:hypothetical protein